MKKLAFTLEWIFATLIASAIPSEAHAEITLDYCLDQAVKNYPMIKKYGILEKTSEISLSDVNKGWLPKINVYGQVTAQNAVPAFPQTLSNMLSAMDQEFDGLGHIQYKAGVDISQTVWDGGKSKAQRNIEKAALDEQRAALDVQLYTVREKVTDLYFGILLIEEQIAQAENLQSLLKANLEVMQSMVKGGVAMQSDADMIEAQILATSQQFEEAVGASQSYREILSIYLGENTGSATLAMPEAEMPSILESARPELHLLEAQHKVTTARKAAIQSTIMPKIGFFAQAYYGYPGLNYFESMKNHNLTFNIFAGLKISWNIDSFYFRRDRERQLDLAETNIQTDYEQFLFNTRLQTDADTRKIESMRRIISDDSRIVNLRTRIRESAESQLRNGVIDITALLSKITEENNARLNARYHEIQLLQNIYKIKNTLNR